MLDVRRAAEVQVNNVIGTLHVLFAMRDVCPDCHLLKLGTMGEYGTPNTDIPEGFFEVMYRGRKDYLPYPRQAGSWYHWSKVHGSNNTMFASRLWGLRATDVMQGVVFGSGTELMQSDPCLRTRLDFDQAFGTVVNRFCCQAVVGHPLTVFGHGGQRRGFLPLEESMECLTLALENPPEAGEYRVFNQFARIHEIQELAETVRGVGLDLGWRTEVRRFENPRMEQEGHYYQPDHQRLFELGYRPRRTVEQEVRGMLSDLLPFRDRIRAYESTLLPDVRWAGSRRKVAALEQQSKALHAGAA